MANGSTGVNGIIERVVQELGSFDELDVACPSAAGTGLGISQNYIPAIEAGSRHAGSQLQQQMGVSR
jgi:hypothetical protein